MHTHSLKIVLILSLALGLFGCANETTAPLETADKSAGALSPDNGSRNMGSIVVANRGSGTISVIDSHEATLTGTHDLPQAEGEAFPEPMYVVHVGRHGLVFVGDRANNRVVAFESGTMAVAGTVPCGAGVFHMWADPRGEQLWVNNDIDNTTTVIDPGTLSVIATVDTPADLVSMGGKPHDVFVGPQGEYAYLTVLGLSGPNDYLIQFATQDFSEINRAPVGKDPHLSMGLTTDLYVPCQNSDQVLVFDPQSLQPIDDIAIPGAHGAIMSHDDRTFFTTNLPGGGTGALNTISTRKNALVGEAVDTPFAVPHNLTVTPDDRVLYVTHSGGAADKVTVYDLEGAYHQPRYRTEITVGLNPFGLAYVYHEESRTGSSR